MAELVDALGSGPSGGNTVQVQILFWATKANRYTSKNCRWFAFFGPLSPINSNHDFSTVLNFYRWVCK